MKKYILMSSFTAMLIATSCQNSNTSPRERDIPRIDDSAHQKADAPSATETETRPTPGEQPAVVDAPVLDEPITLPFGGGFVYGGPFLGGGGGSGGGHPVSIPLPCELGTSDCNDDNPCTVDECVNDVCVNTFDDTKTEFGSCELDGDACTLGRCVNISAVISCHEESRVFIAGEEGCGDDNECTADSCVQSPLTTDEPLQFDEEGNAILRTEHVCVHEILAGAPCIFEDLCSPGFCTVTGTGLPDDAFAVECVEDPGNVLPVTCPDSDNNPCTLESCVIEQGCISTPVAPDTACNDFDPCTIDDACQIDPQTQSFYCFGATITEIPEIDGGFDDGNLCTLDTCSEGVAIHTDLNGPLGSSCTTELLGVCAAGVLQCLEGSEVIDMCIPLFGPGDKEEVCGNGLDDDCDGDVDTDDEDCVAQALIVFVTSTTYTGGFGGRVGADLECQTAAAAGTVTGPLVTGGSTFVAWMADDSGAGVGPATSVGRVDDQGVGYQLTNGTVIATTHADLIDGTLAAAIDRDEDGVQVVGAPLLSWTGANADGTSTTETCANWTTAIEDDGTNGDLSATDGTWSNDGISSCDELRRLYCVQRFPI